MYVVIFTAKIKEVDDQYLETAQRMRKIAFAEYGCTEFKSVTEGDAEITVSYWPDLESIQKWYRWCKVEVAKIERSYEPKLRT